MDLKRKALSGLKWTTFSSFTSSLVKLLQVAILTRYLSKEDFGIIAIAVLFISFTRIFLDLGLSTAIMHKQNISRKEYSSLFWLNVFTGVLLTVLLVLCAPLVAKYYEDAILIPVIQLLSLNVLFSSLGRQSRTIRHKEMNFRFMSNVENSTAILTLILVVILAMNGYGVYSLVYSTMFEIMFSNLIYLINGQYRDKNIFLHFNFSETKSFLKIGIFQLGSAMLDFFAREIDVILISTAFGKDILGAYTLCKRIVQMLYAVITPILIKVATPLMATLQESKKGITQAFVKMLEVVSLVNIPIFALVALLSPIILRVLYGADYEEYSVILTLLAGVYAILASVGSLSSVQIALGRTDIGLYWTIYRIIANTIILYIGSKFSILVMVILLLISTVMNLLPFWRIQVKAMLELSFIAFIKPMLYPFLSSTLLLVLFYNFITNDNYLLSVGATASFLVLYIVGVYIFKREFIFAVFKIK